MDRVRDDGQLERVAAATGPEPRDGNLPLPGQPQTEEPVGQGPGQRVLDVACGTGLWLAAQARAFPDDIAWYGIDASPAMLKRARDRLDDDVDLERGRAEALPYDDAVFDVISCRFAMHHLDDLAQALTEARRVVRDDGTVVLINIVPELMQGWWGYRHFPEAWTLDEGRYIGHAEIHAMLEDRFAVVQTDVRRTLRRVPRAEVVDEIERGDLSQLAMLPDAVLQRGLATVKAGPAHVPTELALGGGWPTPEGQAS